MIANDQQKQRLKEIHKEIRSMFPESYGSVRFNLHPQRSGLNMNISDSIVIEESVMEKK